MKGLLLVCAGLLFLGMATLPIGYYNFLRIVVAIGSISILVTEQENGFNFWNISFGILAILFNPIIPIHLNDKTAWMVIDFISGVIFVIKSFTLKQK